MQTVTAVVAGDVDQATSGLLRALASRFPVRLIGDHNGDTRSARAAGIIRILTPSSPPPTAVDARASLDILRLPWDTGTKPTDLGRTCFNDDPLVDRRLRFQSIPSVRFMSCKAFASLPHDRILATLDGLPVWTAKQPNGTLRMACAMPELTLHDTIDLDTMVRTGTSFVVVPLVHFFRILCACLPVQMPPPRACFVIDDPNLRLETYGQLHYRRLSESARANRFHVSLACVPLDLRASSRSVVRIFRASQKYLSVCLHGNNHTANEMARTRGRRQALRLMAQAVRRAQLFSNKHRLPVSQVMVAPHGSLSQLMCVSAHRAGIASLCADSWAYRRMVDPTHGIAGIAIADFIRDGIPILRRHHISDDGALLHLFLDQPVIQYLHHYDLAGRSDLLDQAAHSINRIAPVEWGSLSAIADSNYTLQKESGTAVVYLHSARCTVATPQGTSDVVIDIPGNDAGSVTGVTVNGRWMELHAASGRLRSEPHQLLPGEASCRIRLQYDGAVDAFAVESPFPTPFYVLRRRASEVRDRLSRHRS